MLQVKKQGKTIKKLKRLLRAKASENNQLSAKVLKLEIAESGDEEETEDGEYMEEESWILHFKLMYVQFLHGIELFYNFDPFIKNSNFNNLCAWSQFTPSR